MFVRAPVGRVSREIAEQRRRFIQKKLELKRSAPQAPFRQRCFIPIHRDSCIIIGAGCISILVGAVMCNFAFHAKELSKYPASSYDNNLNRTNVENLYDQTKQRALESMTFLGPSFMGLGMFVIIIACVFLMDKRDKILKKYMDNMRKNSTASNNISVIDGQGETESLDQSLIAEEVEDV